MPNSLHNLIANGGKVLIIGGYNKSFTEFRDHPQLVFWSGESNEIERKIKNEVFPDPLKAVLISRFSNHKYLHSIMNEARKKRATIFAPLSDGELKRKLKEIIEVPEVPLFKEDKTHFTIKHEIIKEENKMPTYKAAMDFVKAHHNSGDTHPNEARRLLALAEGEGFKTTFGSLYQAVIKYRKSNGVVTDKVITSKKDNTLLDMIDEAITAMKLVRDEVKKLDTQQTDYMKLKNKLAELLS